MDEPEVDLNSLSNSLGESLSLKGGTEHRWTFSVCGGLKRGRGKGVTKGGEAEGQMILKAALKSADPLAHVHIYGWMTDDNGHTRKNKGRLPYISITPYKNVRQVLNTLIVHTTPGHF